MFFFLLCVVNIYLSFTSHYCTGKKIVFIDEDGHVTRNVLNNKKCFFKAFLALLFIIRFGRILTHLSKYVRETEFILFDKKNPVNMLQ